MTDLPLSSHVCACVSIYVYSLDNSLVCKYCQSAYTLKCVAYKLLRHETAPAFTDMASKKAYVEFIRKAAVEREQYPEQFDKQQGEHVLNSNGEVLHKAMVRGYGLSMGFSGVHVVCVKALSRVDVAIRVAKETIEKDVPM